MIVVTSVVEKHCTLQQQSWTWRFNQVAAFTWTNIIRKVHKQSFVYTYMHDFVCIPFVGLFNKLRCGGKCLEKLKQLTYDL